VGAKKMASKLKAKDYDNFYINDRLIDIQLIKCEIERKASGGNIHKACQLIYRLKSIATDLMFDEEAAQYRIAEAQKYLESLGYSWYFLS